MFEGESADDISTSQKIEDDKITAPIVATDVEQASLQLPHTLSLKIDEENDEENGETSTSEPTGDNRFEDNKENTSPPISDKFRLRRQSHITLPSKRE